MGHRQRSAPAGLTGVLPQMSTLRIACYLAALSLVFYGISTFAVLHFLETTKCIH